MSINSEHYFDSFSLISLNKKVTPNINDNTLDTCWLICSKSYISNYIIFWRSEWFATKNASFWGVVTELLIESRSVNAHKQPGKGALVEGTHVSLENINYIFIIKAYLNQMFLLINISYIKWLIIINDNKNIFNKNIILYEQYFNEILLIYDNKKYIKWKFYYYLKTIFVRNSIID